MMNRELKHNAASEEESEQATAGRQRLVSESLRNRPQHDIKRHNNNDGVQRLKADGNDAEGKIKKK